MPWGNLHYEGTFPRVGCSSEAKYSLPTLGERSSMSSSILKDIIKALPCGVGRPTY